MVNANKATSVLDLHSLKGIQAGMHSSSQEDGFKLKYVVFVPLFCTAREHFERSPKITCLK
jgi:hypothetical protein